MKQVWLNIKYYGSNIIRTVFYSSVAISLSLIGIAIGVILLKLLFYYVVAIWNLI